MASPHLLAFVGSLDRPAPYFGAPTGRGISVFGLDPASGALNLLSETAGADNPTFLTVAADGRTLYATSEVFGWHEGVVTAYRIRPDGGLTYINKQPTLGSIAAQAQLDPSGRWLLVANYRLGADGLRPPQAVAVFPIAADGGLGAPVGSVAHQGVGSDPERQDGPHPHCVLFSDDGRLVLVADLGLDRIIGYRFDPASGAMQRTESLATPPGSGPRHLTWIAPGRLVATGEMANIVMSVEWGGTPRLLSVASTLPPAAQGASHAADIHSAPDGSARDGRFVYASNRGHDSIAVLACSAAGELQLLANCATGRTPRSFTLDPSGTLLLVACQDGHEVTVHRRDAHTGLVSAAVARASVGSPMCVRVAAVA